MRRLCLLTLMLAIASCQSPTEPLLEAEKSQLALRSIQTRVFDTPDVQRTLRTVIATLQDLGFVIDEASADLGSVSATKLDQYKLRMTVIVTLRADKQVAVRANAQYGNRAVEDPLPYQQFFAALEKAMFLDAQRIS